MKLLRLECQAGASGDMLLGAMLDLGCPLEVVNQQLGRLGLDGLSVTTRQVSRHGIAATKADVTIKSERRLGLWKDVESLLESSPLTEFVRKRSLSAMRAIAVAEAKIHQVALEQVHFHELGSQDTIADVVGFFAALEKFSPDQITTTPIAVGGGTVKIAHGVTPNPAPATLEILRGLPLETTALAGERTTPTGAALLSTAVSVTDSAELSFGRLEAIGYGAGEADFPDRANLLRASLLFVNEENIGYDSIFQLETTIDDMNPQLFGYVFDRLYSAGCLEAFVAPVTMKKSRPGWNLTVLAPADKRQKLSRILLEETTTAGVRSWPVSRLKASRRIIEVQTRFGQVQVKILEVGKKRKYQPEYDSALALAQSTGESLLEIIDAARQAAEIADCADRPDCAERDSEV